jgi:hypothetical protein
MDTFDSLINRLLLLATLIFCVVGCDTLEGNKNSDKDDSITHECDLSEIKYFIDGFAKGDLSAIESSFDDEIHYFGAFRALDPASVKRVNSKWVAYPREEVMAAYQEMIEFVGKKEWENQVIKCDPTFTKAGKYKNFPRAMPLDIIRMDDAVLDFQMSESVYNKPRATFDEIPVSIFRKVNGRYILVAQIGYIP